MGLFRALFCGIGAAAKPAPALLAALASVAFLSSAEELPAQTEVMAWGNLTGVRVDGELMEFETSFRVAEPGWTDIDCTGRERHETMFVREGGASVVTSSVQGVEFEQRVRDTGAGAAAVSLSYNYDADAGHAAEGAFYAFQLPARRFGSGQALLDGDAVPLDGAGGKAGKASVRKIVVEAEPGGRGGKARRLQLDFATPVTAFVRHEKDESGRDAPTLYITLLDGDLAKGRKGALDFTVAASGDIDRGTVTVTVDKANPGRLFAGLGGNFRLQNPGLDPQVIDYNLENMRVAFGRVEMPWYMWHPQEDASPLDAARDGKLNEQARKSMEMARRLAAMGMPVIVSAWFPPNWAVDGDPMEAFKRGGGVPALRLDPAKSRKVCQSIADYLVYLKQAYGVEAYAFSFNESDIGINVLHTPEEHAVFIKELGAVLAEKGLATKLLLGDNSDATTFGFIQPALDDPETHKYIAAVSFHSWRGCDDETLRRWAGAARRLNVPLLVGEGSTDAAAWRYPQIFLEPAFALYEINLYVRIAAIAQPLSILQWQLTADYSLLWGGGIFQSEGALRPTQRFWNLKQLAATPEDAFALPFASDKEDVNIAAFGNLARGAYAIHLVNNGAARQAVVKGLEDLPEPAELKAYATTDKLEMQELPVVRRGDGGIVVELPATGFVTVLARPAAIWRVCQ
ncbi:MAG: hypothetical protein LBT74_05565 [Acidobacteriota bacterium]|jgi:hypothetical protein|nr:hypothetical protein [Acidobacteriota bacterium]